jgi:hypothetical protein
MQKTLIIKDFELIRYAPIIGALDKYDELELFEEVEELMINDNLNLVDALNKQIDIFFLKPINTKLDYLKEIKEQADKYLSSNNPNSLDEMLNGAIKEYVFNLLLPMNLTTLIKNLIYIGLNRDLEKLRKGEVLSSFTIKSLLEENRDFASLIDEFVKDKVNDNTFNYNYLTFNDLYLDFSKFIASKM